MGKQKKLKVKVRRDKLPALFWIIGSIIVAIIIVLITLDCIYLKNENWITILSSISKDVLTAVIVTSIVSIFVKMITERLFTVKKNDKLLRKFGVSNIGTGVSTKKDVRNIFGCGVLDKFPSEIRLLYITGNVYLKLFQSEMIECLRNGCTVKLLMVSTETENAAFVKRLENVYDKQSSGFAEQIEEVKKTVDDLKAQFPGKVFLRFYRDEYFYNFRSAMYYDKNSDTMIYKSNINVQPFCKSAGDCSIGLSGIYTDKDDDLDNNIFALNNKSFDNLWDKYKDTEYSSSINSELLTESIAITE